MPALGTDLYMIDLETGITRNLTNSTSDDPHPVWSWVCSMLTYIGLHRLARQCEKQELAQRTAAIIKLLSQPYSH